MRNKDWESALFAEIARHRGLLFAWGTSDCLMFPADCVLAMTGRDVFADIRGGYLNQRGAAKLLAAHDCRDVGDAFAQRLDEIHPSRMGRGDLGVVCAERSPGADNEIPIAVSGVICIGAQVIGKPPGQGMVHLPRHKVLRAFKVG